jgi:hypothetical protein
VPERERAQEGPQRRRRRDPATQPPARASRPEHAGVVDAVGAEDHRGDQRHHLAPRVRRTGPIATQPHHPARERLETEPLRPRRDEHHTRVTHDPLIVELDPQPVQSDGIVILHPQGELLTQDATAGIGRFLPAQGVTLVWRPDEPALPHRWIRAKLG